MHDYTGREVGRVGVFAHGSDEQPILREYNRDSWELARLLLIRFGHLAVGAVPSAGTAAGWAVMP